MFKPIALLAGLMMESTCAAAADVRADVVVDLRTPEKSADAVEQLLTVPFERSLRTMPDVKELNSNTSHGVSRIVAGFAAPAGEVELKLVKSRV